MSRRNHSPAPARKRRSKSPLLLPFTIDINADIGEGTGTSRIGEDSAILDLVSSANIACGFHAGDATSMRETVRAAHARGVSIGAHPSHPDLLGFGRRDLQLDPNEVRGHVAAQVKALRRICTDEGARLTYIKPHGALYNRAARDNGTALAIINGMKAVDAELVLLGLAGSEMERAAAGAGVAFASEAFVDRAYAGDLQLVPRGEPGAIIDDVGSAVARAVKLVARKTVTTLSGKELPLSAVSLCVHGDNPRAVEILRALRAALESAGVRIAPFVS